MAVTPRASSDESARQRRSVALTLLIRVVQLGLLCLLGIVILVVGWLQSQDFELRSIQLVERAIEQATGEQATITDLSVTFWPPGVEAEGVHLFLTNGGDTIASVQRVHAPLTLSGGKPGIGALRLERPVLELSFDNQGRPLAFRSAPRPEKPQPLSQLPFRALDIRGGRLRVIHPRGEAALRRLQLTPERDGTHTLDGRLVVRTGEFEDSARLKWRDITLGPEVIDIPALGVRLDSLQLDGALSIDLDGPLDLDASVSVDLPKLQPLLPPPRRAWGRLHADVHVHGPPADPTVETTLLVRELELDVPGKLTPVLHYTLPGDVLASATLRRDGVDVHHARLMVGDGRITASARITPDKRLEDGVIVADRLSLEALLKAFDAAPTPWVDLDGDLEIQCAGTLEPLLLEGDFDLAVADLFVGDRPVSAPGVRAMLDIPRAYAEGRITLTKRHLVLDAGLLEAPRSRGTLRADIGFAPGGPLDLVFELQQTDLAEFQPLNGVQMAGQGAVSGRISGPFKSLSFDGHADLRNFEVLDVPFADHIVAEVRSPDMRSIELAEAAVEVGTSTYSGDFQMDFRSPISLDTELLVSDGRVEDLVGMFIDVPGLTGAVRGTLSLHGPIYDLDGEGHLALAAVEIFGERFDEGHAHGFMDGGVFTLDDLRITRRDEQEGLWLRGSVDREWALDVELIADGLALERLDTLSDTPLPVAGNLGLRTRVTNTLFDPAPSGTAVLTDVRYSGFELEDSRVTFETRDQVLSGRAVLLGGAATAEGTLGLWGEQPYSLEAELDRLPAHLFYPVAADGRDVRAHVSGDLSLGGHFGEEPSPVVLQTTLSGVELEWGRHRLTNPNPWSYTQDGNTFTLRDFSLEGGDTSFELSASGGDELVMEGSGRVDIDLLRVIVPGLTKAEGRASVELAAIGTRPDVEAVVEVDVTADLLRHSSVPATFEELTATLRITEDEVEITGVRGGLGGGAITGRGTLTSTDWIPTRYDLEASIDDAQIQWIDSLPPAIGDASLRFDGPADQLLLSGEVAVSEMTFSDRIDWEDWVVSYREQMLVDPSATYADDPLFGLNVAIRADDTMYLRNNVAEGTGAADLRVIGDTVRPGLTGTVRIKEGVAFLQDREFRIERGNILFNDPWTWDPDIDFALVTDIDSQDQRFRVNYAVFGPFSDWNTSARSDPNLPQADVNALLWFGVTTEDLEEMGALPSAVTQAAADLILTDFFIAGQAGELGQELPDLFDRIDIATGVNGRGEYSAEPRLVIEKRLSDLGDVQLRWELNLVDPEDNYVSADRRIGGIWSLRAWYASLQRDRVLPIGGAYGLDVTARWEAD